MEISNRSYQQLVTSIDEEFQRGIFEAKKQLEHQRLVTYWNVGRDIHRYIQDHHILKEQQKKFFIQLGKDLDRDNYFLKQLCAFFLAYPQEPTRIGISWSHYRELLLIPTKHERQKWEQRVLREGISSKDLGDMIQEIIQGPAGERDDAQYSEKLKCERGSLYIYRIISPNEVPWSNGAVVVDLGFGIRREVEAEISKSLNVGHRVVSYKNDQDYDIKRTDVSAEKMYTYRAVVERVIDGDTIIANIDCGFQCWSHQRLRLRGINTPELSENGGVTAQRFVRRVLKPCAWIIVKTHLDRQDVYGRYLADVFFEAEQADPAVVAAEGTYLNQMLLDKGFAEKY